MLVLTRKPKESLNIQDRVTVTVLEVKSGRVRFGIAAPPEVIVHRREVYDRIRELATRLDGQGREDNSRSGVNSDDTAC